MDRSADTPQGGTALIVVPGVGDDDAGDTVGTMTDALLARIGPGAHATRFTRRIVVPPLPGSRGAPAAHPVECARIARPAPAGPLVVYEMHWADLSRFPGTLRRFVLTLYGMLFQISTIALEALRANQGRTRAQRRLLETFSYLTAVLAVGLTAGAAILGLELAALVRLTERWQQLVIAGLTLVVAAALAWIGDGFLRARGWRFSAVPLGAGRPGLAFGVIAIGVGIAPLVIHAIDGSLEMAVHEVLWTCGVRWVLPVTWALVGLTAIAVCALMAREWARRGGGGAAAQRYRATRTAVLSVVIGGLGIGLLGALLVAAALAATSRAAGTGTPVPREAADDVGAEDAIFGDYAQRVFEQSLRPLGIALLCAAVLIVAIVVAAVPYASALAQARRDGASPLRPWGALGAVVAGAGLIALLLSADDPGADALAVAIAVGALAVACLYWWRRFRPDPARAPLRRGLGVLLAYLGGELHVALITAALFIAALALVLATPVTSVVGEGLGDLSGAIFQPFVELSSGSSPGLRTSTTVAVLIALAAFLASRLPVLARGLDLGYDVATYMRIPHGSPRDTDPVEPPRRRVLRRYATLLDHIAVEQRPDAIVIAAHSQGSMYSLALLFGDEFRDRADHQEAEGWPLAPRVLPDHPDISRERAPAVPPRLALLTAGCPIVQTYAPSFPGQYDWPADVDVVDDLLRRAGPNTTWRNVYRSGDYLGRELWPGADLTDAADPPARPLRRDEFCLGAGQHTGYWGDPRFAAHILALV